MAAPLIGDLLKKTSLFFEKKGIGSPRLQAEALLAHVLGCSRLDLYLRFHEGLPPEGVDAYRALVIRRSTHEPLQYILGTVDFNGLILQVDRRCLIPRPETEELVYRLTQLPPPSRILDLGTGSGAIALSCARHYPDLQVVAADKSEAALALAQENAKLLGLSQRVEFIHSDWFDQVTGRFDWILSNPPYLTEEEWQQTQPEVLQFEPLTALVAQEQGASDLLHILDHARRFLAPGGLVALETGEAHGELLSQQAQKFGYASWECHKDLAQKQRFFFARIAN